MFACTNGGGETYLPPLTTTKLLFSIHSLIKKKMLVRITAAMLAVLTVTEARKGEVSRRIRSNYIDYP